jgi:putative membrane protein
LNKSSKLHLILLISFLVALIWSAIKPHDYFTWILEVFPAIFGVAFLVIIYPRFRFTNLVYILIFIHCLILIVGGHYTYAEVPLFNWLREAMQSGRNNYDKVGHFAQGFVPAMIARELLIRKQVVNGRGWLFFLVTTICLSISAFYEFIEWWVAILSGSAGDSFLGTQGYIWDTQSDMFLALVGAILAQLFLNRLHDNALKDLLKQS